MENQASDNLRNTEGETVYYCKVILAEKKIEIESFHKRTLAYFKGYLSQFDKPDFVISPSQQDILQELNTNYGEHLKEIDQQEGIAVEYFNAETNVIYRMITEKMLEYGIILMHGAAVSVNNKCYIFTAPSGTGKTTHIYNWLKAFPEAFVVNGDKPLINVEKGLVYGTPWSGKEGMNTNTSVPLSGIIYLERGLTNIITPISFKDILPYLIKQTYMPSLIADRIKVYNHLSKLKDVPFYQLKCNMEEE